MGAIIGTFGGAIDSAAVVVTSVERVIEAVTIRAAVGMGAVTGDWATAGDELVLDEEEVLLLGEGDPLVVAVTPVTMPVPIGANWNGSHIGRGCWLEYLRNKGYFDISG